VSVVQYTFTHKKYQKQNTVVSAGWQLTINAFPPGQVQFGIAEREQQMLHSEYLSEQPLRRNNKFYFTNHQ
jgi:hypothetical protein